MKCPPFEYEKVKGADSILEARCAAFALSARENPEEVSRQMATDSRPTHGRMFKGLTPAGYEYYAGHYRGEQFPCLIDCQVGIAGDPAVGAPPANVGSRMRRLSQELSECFAALDAAQPSAAIGRDQKVYFAVVVAARAFVDFLTIHPYVNGNGHVARCLVLATLGRYGLWLKRWSLNRRPQDPPYSPSIAAYRRNRKDLLEGFILQCLVGT